MERFVDLQKVVTLLCGFEKKYGGNNEKNQQIRVISNSGISIFCGRITIGIDSICIIFEYTAHVPASKLVIFSLD